MQDATINLFDFTRLHNILIISICTYFEVVLIRLNRLNDDCVEFRISKPVPPAVVGGTTVIGNDDGSLIMLSMDSGSS